MLCGTPRVDICSVMCRVRRDLAPADTRRTADMNTVTTARETNMAETSIMRGAHKESLQNDLLVARWMYRSFRVVGDVIMARRKLWEVNDELWAVIEPLLPRHERRFRHPGRKRIDDR